VGRPSKGEREVVRARLPLPLAAALRDAAQRRGLTVNDFLGRLAEEATGVPYTPYTQKRRPVKT